MGSDIMNEMIVLIDFETEKGETRGIVADLGSDLFQIADHIRMTSKTVGKFLGAFVLAVSKEEPAEPYIPPNGFAMTYGDDKAINHPQLGKVWTTLVAHFPAGGFDEEE